MKSLPSHRHIDTFGRSTVIRDTKSAISEQDERIRAQRYTDFCRSVLPDCSRSGRQDRDLHKNRREMVAQNTATRNWQNKCFSRIIMKNESALHTSCPLRQTEIRANTNTFPSPRSSTPRYLQRLGFTFALALFLASTVPTRAQDALSGDPPAPSAELLSRNYLLGDWGGERTALAEKGIVFVRWRCSPGRWSTASRSWPLPGGCPFPQTPRFSSSLNSLSTNRCPSADRLLINWERSHLKR